MLKVPGDNGGGENSWNELSNTGRGQILCVFVNYDKEFEFNLDTVGRYLWCKEKSN